MLVALAAKCLAGLATGLRKKFGQYAGHVSSHVHVLDYKTRFKATIRGVGLRGFDTGLVQVFAFLHLEVSFH